MIVLSASQVIDGLDHHLVVAIETVPRTDALDILWTQAGLRGDGNVVRPQILAVAVVHYAQQRDFP